MVKPLVLDIINTLAASGAYGGQRALSATSEVTIQSVSLWLSNLENWQGADFDLTEEEIDEIEALVADLQEDVMTESEETVSDYVKIAEAVATADVADISIDNFDAGTFHTYKLIIQGLKTDYGSTYVEHLGIEFNEDDAAAHYTNRSEFSSQASTVKYEHLSTLGYFYCDWFCSTTNGNQAAIGNAEFTIYAPQSDDYKSIAGRGSVNNFQTGQVFDANMSGMFKNEGEVTQIRIFPVLGTTFKVDPDSGSRPSELRMTLYGMR